MKSLLRRNLLLLMLGATAAAFTINIHTPAFAKNGSDDGSSSSSSSSGSSGSGSSSSSGSSDDNSGSGGGDDNNSGSGSGGDDNSSGGNSSDDNSSNDDSNNRSASNDDRRNGGGGNRANRPRVQISVDAATRASLLNGTLVAVDNLGRPLEVEVEDGGVLIAKPHGGDAKRKPGPITSFNVVPAAQAPVHQ